MSRVEDGISSGLGSKTLQRAGGGEECNRGEHRRCVWPAPGRAEHPRPRPPPRAGQRPTPGGVGRGGRPRLDVRRRVYKGDGSRGDPQRRSRAAAEPSALPRRLLPEPDPPVRCCRAACSAPWPCSPSPWPSAPSRPPPRTRGSGSSCRSPWLPPPGSRNWPSTSWQNCSQSQARQKMKLWSRRTCPEGPSRTK